MASATAMKAKNRPSYRPSGRVNWPLFIALSAAVMIAAALCGLLMMQLLVWGIYLRFLAPAVIAIALAAVTGYAIDLGQCRNPLCGLLLGLTAGIIAYVGYYHFAMVSAIGMSNISRLDLLPDYINYRMNSDVVKMLHQAFNSPAPKGPLSTSDVLGNWFLFVVELFIVVGIPAFHSLKAAKKAYCERCKRWMPGRSKHLTPDAAHAVIEALDTQNLAALNELSSPGLRPGNEYTVIQMERCPTFNCKRYMSVGLAKADKNGKLRGIQRSLLRQVELSPEESKALTV